MRFNRGSQEASQQIEVKKKYKQSQNGQSQQNYIDDQDPINCPLIFKAILMTLITIGILAFIITFATQVQQSSELYTDDFKTCGDSSNVRRLNKFYAYEKMILGLSISGFVLAFGLTVFLIKHSYDFCRCFDDCYGVEDQESQQESESQNNGDVQEYEDQLKKRIQANIVLPKDQMSTANVILPKKKPKQKQEPKIMVRNPHIRKYLKSLKQIREIDQEYNKNGGNSDQINCDCQCDDIGSCLACCVGCLWCRTCFQAHHYRFYKSKNQQYAYWVIYMVKTLFFGTALAYVIRINVSLNELGWCSSENAKKYNDALYNVMVIGIITFCLDFFGYVHLLIEGSLLEVIEGTLHQPQKSEHSEESDSDDESQPEDKKKKAKKYKESQSESQEQKGKKKKTTKTKKQSQQVQQSSQSQEIPTKINLISSIKKDKSKPKNIPQQQVPPSAKDTDSFFIKIKTLGNKFINDIGNSDDEDESEESKKQQNKKKNKKEVTEPQSQESYESSNKKPDIFVPKGFDKLPKLETKKPTVMVREEESVRQESFWKKQMQNKTQFSKFGQQRDSQKVKQQFGFKKAQERPAPSGPTKFGAFNRAPESNNTFNREPIKPQTDQKDNKMNQFQKLSKFSTKF